MGNHLKFRDDGSFKIAQLTDLHLGKDEEKDQLTIKLIEKIIEEEKPDLLVYTGDLISGDFLSNMDISKTSDAFRMAIKPAISSNLPWTIVFGNHDAEGGMTKHELLEILMESKTCLFQAGPREINGVGNYVLTIEGSNKEKEEEAALYFFDSGENALKSFGGYDWIHTNQINWYMEQSRLLSNRNGGPIPSLAFFHIALPEYKDVWESGKCNGNKQEGIGSPTFNSGLFTAMLDAEDVIGTFVGHDHMNDYDGKYHGIHLCYGRVTGYGGYGELKPGVRLIRLLEGKKEFDTWIMIDNS